LLDLRHISTWNLISKYRNTGTFIYVQKLNQILYYWVILEISVVPNGTSHLTRPYVRRS